MIIQKEHPRSVMAQWRGGDYAHAGSKESIDMVIRKALELAPEIISGNCLDIGSGFGGTANDIYHCGFHHIWGIDKDPEAIAYATKKYPDIPFIHADAADLPSLFQPSFFSFICLFNVIYGFEDKFTLFKNIAQVSKPGALLCLFDYSHKSDGIELKDLVGRPIYPMKIERLKIELPQCGWKIIENVDLTDRYIQWYQDLVAKIPEDLALRTPFIEILTCLNKGSLGGAAIYAVL